MNTITNKQLIKLTSGFTYSGITKGDIYLDKLTDYLSRECDALLFDNTDELKKIRAIAQKAMEAKQVYLKKNISFIKAVIFYIFSSAYRNDVSQCKSILKAERLIRRIDLILENDLEKTPKILELVNGINGYWEECKQEKLFQTICKTPGKFEGKKIIVGNNIKGFVLKSHVYVKIANLDYNEKESYRSRSLYFNVKTGELVIKTKPKKDNKISENYLRVKSELDIKKKLGNHQGVIQHIGFLKHKNKKLKKVAIIDKFFSVNNLAKIEKEKINEDRYIILLDTISGLSHLHQKGFIYGSIKPENIEIRWNKSSYQAALSLFDQIRKYPCCSSKSKKLSNQKSYYSEITTDIDYKNDIFSYGILLVNLFYGLENFTSDFDLQEKSIQMTHTKIISFLKNNTHFQLNIFILSLLDPVRSKRPSAREILNFLEQDSIFKEIQEIDLQKSENKFAFDIIDLE